MTRWEKALISPESTLREALERIDSCGCQMALVVDDSRKLLGMLTDGDVRRALLKGTSLTDLASSVMRTRPHCVHVGDDRGTILALMHELGVHHIPVLDANDVIVDLEMVEDFLLPRVRDEWVIVMAGGLGTRLEDLTRDTPKPMLKVGSRPLLETIVHNYADQGFRKFYFAVNYKAEQIEAYFGDGTELGLEIRYLRENKRMGTAGALTLLPEKPNAPIIVTNADLLTKQDFGQMMDLHIASRADATVSARDYEIQVPFGVICESGGRMQGIQEKPTHSFNVSAGVNILSPNVLNLIPKDTFFDMPSLFEAMMSQSLHVRVHKFNGYWLDIGRLTDYEKANLDFEREFY
ncbi:nucleotidyltransferase family protein [Chromobacterium haemolyticum]|uniref:nucleotidyltransferase family protein n=1 Tax=Chromobacterium haemolyticum TaxID=394935 RepID=UPI0009DB66E3|nr:nucleotidyltransferase family protein [Chromobacterium haemolyticum]OQS42503.1 alcohol dehydrogenase [Chromobacterium haemolyticum]